MLHLFAGEVAGIVLGSAVCGALLGAGVTHISTRYSTACIDLQVKVKISRYIIDKGIFHILTRRVYSYECLLVIGL